MTLSGVMIKCGFTVYGTSVVGKEKVYVYKCIYNLYGQIAPELNSRLQILV